MKPLIAIVGPTAVGKSSLAIDLAQKFNGEIVNADSRQVYRHMDIGTAKPTPQERSLVPYHLIDLVDSHEDFNLAIYQDLAYKAINDIHQREKLPFLVGGTGLYVWAVLEGWSMPAVPPDPQLRQKLESRAKTEGTSWLYEELRELDPAAAQQLDPRNQRRIIRALEVCHLTNQRFSELKKRNPPGFNTLIIGVTADRAELYRRIDSRLDSMINQGFIDEVRRLIEMGYSPSLPSMSSIGYREIAQYLSGDIGLSKAIQRIKFETHRLARHQYTWFRLDDQRIHWFNTDGEAKEKAVELINRKYFTPSQPQ